MKKTLMLALLTLFVISGCSSSETEDDKNKGLEFSNYQYGIGSIDNTDTFDKQKLQYDITISNKEKTKLKKESVEIVLTDWINEKQTDNKITEINFNNDNINIKGYVIFDTKGLTKEQIISNEPFIKGVKVVTDLGMEILIKQ